MAEQSFSMLCNEILTKYPQIINSATQIQSDKTQIASDKAEIATQIANATSQINNIKAQMTTLKDSANTELDSKVASAKTELNNKVASALSNFEAIKTQANSTLANVRDLENSASGYADAAQASMQNIQNVEQRIADDVLASNAAKVKALEYAAKAQTDLSEVIRLNNAFDSKANASISTLNNKTSSALSDINTKGALINSALEAKSDYEMGRMEFKRRQVDEKIKQANAVIAGLETGSLPAEIKRLVAKNKWDRALLECGILDAILSKGELLFINEECEQVKEATRKISIEVEMDRLEIIRHREVAKEAASKAQEFAKQI